MKPTQVPRCKNWSDIMKNIGPERIRKARIFLMRNLNPSKQIKRSNNCDKSNFFLQKNADFSPRTVFCDLTNKNHS